MDLVQIYVHTGGIMMSNFKTNLDPQKMFVDETSLILIKIFVASAVGKIHKLRTAKLREHG